MSFRRVFPVFPFAGAAVLAAESVAPAFDRGESPTLLGSDTCRVSWTDAAEQPHLMHHCINTQSSSPYAASGVSGGIATLMQRTSDPPCKAAIPYGEMPTGMTGFMGWGSYRR
jgi:hypothetical protein